MHAREAMRQDPALQVVRQFALDERRQRAFRRRQSLQERRQFRGNHSVQHRPLGPASLAHRLVLSHTEPVAEAPAPGAPRGDRSNRTHRPAAPTTRTTAAATAPRRARATRPARGPGRAPASARRAPGRGSGTHRDGVRDPVLRPVRQDPAPATAGSQLPPNSARLTACKPHCQTPAAPCGIAAGNSTRPEPCRPGSISATKRASSSIGLPPLAARAGANDASGCGWCERLVSDVAPASLFPPILILDEPTSGLDPNQRRKACDVASICWRSMCRSNARARRRSR